MFNKSSKTLIIYILSEDQKNFDPTISINKKILIQKLKRDGLNPEINNFFLLMWARYQKEEQVNRTIVAKHISSGGIFRRFIRDIAGVSNIVQHTQSYQRNPDIIAVYNPALLHSALKIKKVRGGAIVLFLTNLPQGLARTRRWGLLRSLYYHRIEKRSYGISDKAFVISEATRTYAKVLGVPNNEIYTFSPNVIAIDTSIINSVKKGIVRSQYKISDDKKVILSVGRLEKEKNFPRLIEIFRALNRKDVVLIIVGEGSEHDRLKKLVAKYNLKESIICAGFVSRTDIWNYFYDADIFMLLSQSEGLGLVFWEAMYARVPVIGSMASGILETIGADGLRGFLIKDQEDTSAVSAKIDACIARGDAVSAMIEHAHAYVSEKISHTTTINDIIGGAEK